MYSSIAKHYEYVIANDKIMIGPILILAPKNLRRVKHDTEDREVS